jgi:hypothetical protein
VDLGKVVAAGSLYLLWYVCCTLTVLGVFGTGVGLHLYGRSKERERAETRAARRAHLRVVDPEPPAD